MINDKLRKMELFSLVEMYFKQRFPGASRSVDVRGTTRKWSFDFIVENEDGAKFGVVVKDWARTLGVNQVRQLQKACQDVSLDGGVLISNRFSPSALQYGDRYGVSCFSKYDIMDKL
ncbi:hypothetical protein GF325_01375 [Candidatus Bathyarchaeota archaeon]|nr:hypothetical protein [Candidatus Bathyarchaeota archaeon]